MPLWGAILYNGFTYFQVIRMLNNATRMAVGMSDRAYASDARDSMRGLFNSIAYGFSNSIAYGLNSSVRRSICERLDMFLPERLRRWLPNNFKYRNQQQESELVLLRNDSQ
ncbi:hypothetical protein Lalb_Chr23g0268021 [Lupinus albus]|uniref:Uncharacterized protein n=1 Tax=Lupinus albus TaxID=3870 RepID=A0A6A4NJR0_LUPAL|nr:hypothetical protein Lalb_Chr23g0268021 [Lupinus albus]